MLKAGCIMESWSEASQEDLRSAGVTYFLASQPASSTAVLVSLFRRLYVILAAYYYYSITILVED